MTEAQTQSARRFMREEPHPALPAALETAAAAAVAASADALSEFRAAALSALRKTGFPTARSEDFSFLRVSEFLPCLGSTAVTPAGTAPARAEIDALVFPECRDGHLVFVDGNYAPGLSNPPRDFQVTYLDEAWTSLPAETRQALLRAAAEEGDAAAALALIFARPLLIRVAAKAAPKAPLQILHYRSAFSIEPRRHDACVVILAERLSESAFIFRHTGAAPASGAMANLHTLLRLDDGASAKILEAGPALETAPSASNAGDIHFRKLGASLSRDSRLSVLSATTGSRLARNAVSVDLDGPGAEADLAGAAVLSGARQNHNFLVVRHRAPNCVSRQHFKTVAAEKSRASVDGTVIVNEGAQLTNANQLINNLMLSDEARADSKPRLMIHADDVKCTHGATIGKLDAAQQFYLESRGLPPAHARALLTVAFIGEITDKIGKADGAGKAGEAGGAGKAGEAHAAAQGFRDHVEQTLVAGLRRQAGAGDQ